MQPSFFGTDNTELLAALGSLDEERFAGVAVLDETASVEQMGALVAQGVRGLRWNLVEGGALPAVERSATMAFLQRLVAAGMHLEINLEGVRLGTLLPQLAPHVRRLALDYFARPSNEADADAALLAAIRAARRHTDILLKFSAPYRASMGPSFCEALANILGPGRVVWGSDWPFTRNEGSVSYAQMVERRDACFGLEDDAAATRELYGIRGV